MSTVGQIERATQNRVVRLFREQLGYRHLGKWEERPIGVKLSRPPRRFAGGARYSHEWSAEE